jgi:peroxiredoxin
MNVAILLSLGAAASVLLAIANYQPKIRRNIAPAHPRFEQSLMIAALTLAITALIAGPTIVSAIISLLAAFPALLFLLGTTQSGLPLLRPAVTVGHQAPDFAVVDANGARVRLSDMRGSAVLLKFYRGYWCPYCVGELEQLAGFASRFEDLGVKLVAISSDTVDELRKFRAKQPWDILLLADPDLTAHRLYNVASRNFAPKRGPFRDLAVPTTMLIGADGRVLWFELSRDFRIRPQADVVFDIVRTILKHEKSRGREPQAA